MNDIMKIILIFALGFGIWKWTGGDLSKLIPGGDKKAKSSSYESSEK